MIDRARDTSLTAESTRLREILEKRYEGIDLKTMEYKGQVGGGRTAITISSNGKSWEERDPLRVMELLLQNNYTDLEGYASRQKAKGMPVPAGFKEAVVEKFRDKVFEFELTSR